MCIHRIRAAELRGRRPLRYERERERECLFLKCTIDRFLFVCFLFLSMITPEDEVEHLLIKCVLSTLSHVLTVTGVCVCVCTFLSESVCTSD